MLRYAVGLVALLTVFSSCEPKVNLIGEYEEKPLIYGLLDPSESVHLFRIQKAFLGEESAFIMAQNPDSSYFKYEDLFVELVEYDGSDETNRWVLDTININNKETGNPDDEEVDFFGPSQRLYKYEGTLDVDREYEITLKKRPVGMAGEMTIANMDTVTQLADSRISLIGLGSFRFENPNQNLANSSSRKMTLVNQSGEGIQYVVKFRQAENVGQYEVWLRFHFREIRNNVEELKSIEWLARQVDIDVDNQGLTEIQVPITAEEIYSQIGSEVPEESDVIRKIGKADDAPADPYPTEIDGHTQDFDIVIRMAGNELFEYMEINDPNSSGVLQDKPVYTNINNGLGVFSSRSQVDFLNRIYLSTESYDELVGGEFTSNRGFVVDPD